MLFYIDFYKNYYRSIRHFLGSCTK